MGDRFQRAQTGQTAHRRPFHPSNAICRPTGNVSSASLVPKSAEQKMQLRYMRKECGPGGSGASFPTGVRERYALAEPDGVA
jgi:hypothetical protein